jgi:hypothetical protein
MKDEVGRMRDEGWGAVGQASSGTLGERRLNRGGRGGSQGRMRVMKSFGKFSRRLREGEAPSEPASRVAQVHQRIDIE